MNARSRLIQMLALASLLVSGAALADPEFNVDFRPADNGQTLVWLSYLADDSVTALDFTVHLDVPDAFSADVSKCLASLPKSHTGLCRLDGKSLHGVIYSPENRALPDANLGSVLVTPGSLAKSGGQLGVSGVDITTVTAAGRTVNANVRVQGQAIPPNK